MSDYDLAYDLAWELYSEGACIDNAIDTALNRYDLSTAEINKLTDSFD